MEQVCERENLKRALAQVKRNKGSDAASAGEMDIRDSLFSCVLALTSI